MHEEVSSSQRTNFRHERDPILVADAGESLILGWQILLEHNEEAIDGFLQAGIAKAGGGDKSFTEISKPAVFI